MVLNIYLLQRLFLTSSVVILATIAASSSVFAVSPSHITTQRTHSFIIQIRQALTKADEEANTGAPGTFRPVAYKKIVSLLKTAKHENINIPPRLRARIFSHEGWYLYKYSERVGILPKKQLRALQKNSIRLLNQAVVVDPTYSNGWARLGWFYMQKSSQGVNRQQTHDRKNWAHCTRKALQTDPHNPAAQLLRLNLLLPPTEAAWKHDTPKRQAFCYRALMYLKYRPKEKSKHRPFYYGFSYTKWLRSDLKKWAPKQLAALDAGTWKPNPQADPLPRLKASATQKSRQGPTTGAAPRN